MGDLTYFPVDQVKQAADHVIAELRDDPNAVTAIPIPERAARARERRDLIGHHQAVVPEVGRGAWSAKAIVRPTPAGSVLAIDLHRALGRARLK